METGATRSHGDTRKSTRTRASAPKHTHPRPNGSPVHTRPLHTSRPLPSGRGKGQRCGTAAGTRRAAPRLASTRACATGGGSGWHPRALPQQGQACPREWEELPGGGIGEGAPRGGGGARRGGRGRGAYKIAFLPGINKPRLAPSSGCGAHSSLCLSPRSLWAPAA